MGAVFHKSPPSNIHHHLILGNHGCCYFIHPAKSAKSNRIRSYIPPPRGQLIVIRDNTRCWCCYWRLASSINNYAIKWNILHRRTYSESPSIHTHPRLILLAIYFLMELGLPRHEVRDTKYSFNEKGSSFRDYLIYRKFRVMDLLII